MTANLIDILHQRGLVAQQTDAQLRQRLEQPTVAYCGFDPTADSLHVGSLVPIMSLAWLQRCGHTPIALVGGATGLIGDPSGKSDLRRMLSAADIRTNLNGLEAQLRRFLRFGDQPGDAALVDNAEWLGARTWIDILREYGPHFTVNRMLSMDSVRTRLDSGGMTFLEFNYMVMQAADFVHLHRRRGCTLQLGGQDQWGNIVMGIELGRRLDGAELAGLTLPLVTRADGGKFGKSEQGTVWLAAERTPVHDFYQFWRNVADADIGRYLRFFTFLDLDAIEDLERREGAALNEAKEVLAHTVTAQIHGQAAADQARDDARRAFGVQRDVSGEGIPHAALAAAELEAGIGVLDLLVRAGFCASKGAARRLIQGRGARLADVVIEDPTRILTTADLADGHLILRAGKKKFFRFDCR